MKNTAIPIMINTLHNLKSLIELEASPMQMLSPIAIILCFLAYPAVMVKYLKKNKSRMLDKDDHVF